MKKFIFKASLFLFIVSFCSSALYSQASSGSEPMSKLAGINSPFETKTTPSVDRERLLNEDRDNLSDPAKPFRYGTVFEVGYNMSNSGTWTSLPDGSRVWRLGITSPNALSINLFFNDFYLPQGGQMFVYNTDKSTTLGAFTYLNNTQDNSFAVAPTWGETTVIEYYEPAGVKGKGRINVSQVVHAYRDIFGYLTTDELACNININCPVAAPWVEQKRSVTRITFTQGGQGFLCTGSLMNNTLQDRSLLYLTAEHCAPDNHASMVFYFNYENPTCTGTSGPMNQTISGATLKASNYDTDFRLVELNGTLPASYNAYFNGWDKTNTQPTSEVAIHHPGGANKKYSKDNDAATTNSGFGGRLFQGFWQVFWDAGMTEGGSSGCPLYDQNKRVIGQNLGGTTSQCENPQNVSKVFGKLARSWDNGGSSNNQLKNWLDPNNSNVGTLDGIDAVTGIAPVANFTSDIQVLPITGGTVNFTDLTSNSPTSWSWSFPGGTPSSSNSQNPTNISYTQTGAYTVTLTTTNQFGSNVKTFVNYIKVEGVPLNAFSLVSPPTQTTLVVSNSDPTTVLFNWTKSTPGPTIKYNFRIKKIGNNPEFAFVSDNSGLDTSLAVRKNLLDSVAALMGFTGDSVRCTWRASATNGVDTLYSGSFLINLKSTTIGITPIGNVVPETFNLFSNYPNPFNPKTNITFDVPKSQFVKLRVFDMQGKEIAFLVNQNLTAGRYTVDFEGGNLASGVYFYSLETPDFYKVNKMVLVK